MQGHLQQMQIELQPDPDQEEYTALRRALLKGMFHNAARRSTSKGGYKSAYTLYGSRQEVQLHPSSVLVSSRPNCVVFSEVVLTSRPYAHVATVVDAAWLPELVPTKFFTNHVQA